MRPPFRLLHLQLLDRPCLQGRLVLVVGALCAFVFSTSTLPAQQVNEEKDLPDNTGNEEVRNYIRGFKPRGTTVDKSSPSDPAATRDSFEVQSGLTVDVACAEPLVRQPVFLNFDHRGRMWVVQYLQYPFPAGLKVVEYDQHLRAKFDKVPKAPPNHVPGADRISVYEDRDGDGYFESSKDVITGLNIATSVTLGRGGIWVLNPPYLLFYPDVDQDDIPDGDPEVHLAGFGLEDTHSVANSLRWGPDGWLYGANGSTCTGTVKGVRFLGQNIWRYHPETRRFEIFAEGGGNTFCVEFDAKGRVYSGHNGGNTRGFHYVQGGCYLKNWGKHGPLMNPYSFGFFKEMSHSGFNTRFSHCFVVYDGAALPYDGEIVSVIPLHNRVQSSLLITDGSTFRTQDSDRLLFTKDRWFRPVDIKTGPDGAVYIADWYDSRLTHVDPRDNWDRKHGRIWRLRSSAAKPIKSFDLSARNSHELVDLLSHANKWHRQQALRLLGDRRDRSVIPRLRAQLLDESSDPQLALESLWALNLSGGLDEDAAIGALQHKDPDVRRWAIRLIGDRSRATRREADALLDLAWKERRVEVRSQLASSAERLDAKTGLGIARELLTRNLDGNDRHIPLLLWWAIEAQCAHASQEVVGLFEETGLWRSTTVRSTIVSRLAKRFALGGTKTDLRSLARLIELAPNRESRRLVLTGLREGFAGRSFKGLPQALQDQLAEHSAEFPEATRLPLLVQLGDAAAVQTALEFIVRDDADKPRRIELIQLFGELHSENAIDSLFEILTTSRFHSVRRACLSSLEVFSDESVGTRVLGLYSAYLPDEQGVRSAAHKLLTSRAAWARQLLLCVEAETIPKEALSAESIERLRRFEDDELGQSVARLWGVERKATPQELSERIEAVRETLAGGTGNPARGLELFKTACGKCHTLFDEGGDFGPELTGYERDNLEFMLRAIIDPSAGVRGEYLNYVAIAKDGRAESGLLVAQDNQSVELRNVENQRTKLSKSSLVSLKAQKTSLMPEGLLDTLDEQQIRDLFSFLTLPTKE